MVETRENRKVSGGGRWSGSMLTTGEACRLLNVHSNTLRRWAATGMIKAYRMGPATHRRYRREDVAALLVEQNRFRGPGVND
jgi:excisionase family DNA binding protein